MKKYKDDSFVLWKAVMYLSAFPLNKIIEILEKIKRENYNTILYDEAVRSLKLIGAKSGM